MNAEISLRLVLSALDHAARGLETIAKWERDNGDDLASAFTEAHARQARSAIAAHTPATLAEVA